MSRSETDNSQKLLAALVGVLLVVLAWRFVVPAVQEWLGKLGDRSQLTQQVAETREITRGGVVPLQLAHLSADTGAYQPDRNIFRYGQRKIERPVPPPVKPREKPKVAPPPPPPPPPPATRQPPPVNFELMGIFGPEKRRIAVLVDGSEIINALEEDVLKDQFIVNEIGLQSVEFRFVDFPVDETARIEIGER